MEESHPSAAAAPRKKLWPPVALGALGLAVATFFLVLKLARRDVPVGAACGGGCGDLSCIDGSCTKRCATTSDCPKGTKCTSDGVCSVPLRAGFIYVGLVEDEGWTKTHDIGRRYAASKLPYLETDYAINAYQPADAERAVDDFVAQGMSVIVANSSTMIPTIVEKAKQYPATRFIVTASKAPDPNVSAIDARLYEAWYLAGFAAAQKSQFHRIGFVGALVTPEVVRHINAFTRGARLADAKVLVEVRWLGFRFDTGKPNAQGRYKEEQLAHELWMTGCDVIAHHADNGRVVAAVEARKGANIFSIGHNNIDACSKGPTTCLGAAYWNWGPLYVEHLDAIHRGKRIETPWAQIQPNPEVSGVGFAINAKVAGERIPIETGTLLADIAKDGGAKIFRGPYCSTGQRPSCVGDGEQLSDDELQTMCWFVEGVIEKSGTADRPARVPPECTQNAAP